MTGFHFTGTAVPVLPESWFPFHRIPGSLGLEYSLSENEDLGILGGWFSQNLYNIEGDFGGMAGDYGVTSFSVFYEYGSEYPLNTWLSLSLTTSDGTEIWDVVPLISN